MSTPEDGGMATPQEAFGGWPGMDLETETAPATETPPAAEPEAPAEGAPPEGAPPTEGEATTEPEQPEWRKYGFKDEEAMWTSYKELQRAFHSRQPAPAEPEEAFDEEDEAALETWKSHNFQSLGEIPRVGLSAQQRTELADLMQVDPKAAALWAMQNQQYMEQGDFKAVQNNWAQNDPFEYHEFRQAVQVHMAEQQRQESQASQQEWVLTQQREHAISEAKAALPLMGEKSDEFGDWLAAAENKDISVMLDSIQDPARLKNALVSAFYQFAGPQLYQEMVSSHAQAAQQQSELEAAAAAEEQARANASKGARTQTRTAPAAPDAGLDADEALRQAILSPWGGS